MAVRYMTPSDMAQLAQEDFQEREQTISGPHHQNLGAVRGFAFAMLIEASLALFAGVGWEVWKFLR